MWFMAVTRLSDSQKQELVARFREGEATQALAEAYGCSPNTVSRVVKAALDPATYAEIKLQRSRGAAGPDQLPLGPGASSSPLAAEALGAPLDLLEPFDPLDPLDSLPGEDADQLEPDQHRVLAIDDADDFGDDAQDDPDLEADDEGEPFEASEFVTVAVVGQSIEDRPPPRLSPSVALSCPAASTCWWTRPWNCRPARSAISQSWDHSAPMNATARPWWCLPTRARPSATVGAANG